MATAPRRWWSLPLPLLQLGGFKYQPLAAMSDNAAAGPSDIDLGPSATCGTPQDSGQSASEDLSPRLETALDFLKATSSGPEVVPNARVGVAEEDDTRPLMSSLETVPDGDSPAGVSESDSGSACLGCRAPGLILAMMSAFFLSLCSVLVKVLDRFEPAELAAIRFVGILVPSLCVSVYRKYTLFPAGYRRLLVLRALLGTTALICKFYAIRQTSLANASVILLSAPVFVAIFARLFLREPCGWIHVVTIALTLVGMVLITQPPALFGGQPLTSATITGSILAFTSTLFGANVYITMRLLKAVPPIVIMTNFAAVAGPSGLVVCLVVGELRVPRSLLEGGLLVVLGLSSFLGQLCLTWAVHLEEAGLVAIVRTICEVLLAVGWQLALFRDVPGLLTVCGMVLVTFSVVMVGLKKWVIATPEDSRLRVVFPCLV